MKIYWLLEISAQDFVSRSRFAAEIEEQDGKRFGALMEDNKLSTGNTRH